MIGQSDLQQASDCKRKFYYRHELGLIPKDQNVAMAMGTLFHAGAAAGYRRLRDETTSANWDGRTAWLACALEAAATTQTDRDGMPLQLAPEKRENVADMLTYFWTHVGQHDRFRSILAIEEPVFIDVDLGAGRKETIRGTLDLMVEDENGDLVIYDHKTSADINQDIGHMALDAQVHVYYLGATATLRRPARFVHNFVRRFEEKDKTIAGPPSFTRADGSKPYALTATGKARTASDDPNDYVRRPPPVVLSDNQLRGYYAELVARIRLLDFCRQTMTWPREDTKLGFGCTSCPYWGVCTTELDGRSIDPARLRDLYDLEADRARTALA